MGCRGQGAAADVCGADPWVHCEAFGAQERRPDAQKFTDGEGSCGARSTGLRNGTGAVVGIDRPLCRGRSKGMHQASAQLLWAVNAGRVGDIDVQTSGPSSSAVWGLAPGGASTKFVGHSRRCFRSFVWTCSLRGFFAKSAKNPASSIVRTRLARNMVWYYPPRRGCRQKSSIEENSVAPRGRMASPA